MKTTCKKSWPVNIFSSLNVVSHLIVPAGWGSCLLRLAIFSLFPAGDKQFGRGVF